MRKTYELYFRAGNEDLSFKHCLFAENDNEAIRTALKSVESLKEYIGTITMQIVLKYGMKQVANITF